jgi:hypothetical protein
LPISELARTLLGEDDGRIRHQRCATYIHAVQGTAWFKAAFTAHAEPVAVVGGKGISHADAARRRVKIGTDDRWDVGRCEHACLHELAHIVTNDHAVGGERREPGQGRGSSRGHHHAWRANFVLIVRMTLGRQAATRLRHEFDAWGLSTHR